MYTELIIVKTLTAKSICPDDQGQIIAVVIRQNPNI